MLQFRCCGVRPKKEVGPPLPLKQAEVKVHRSPTSGGSDAESDSIGAEHSREMPDTSPPRDADSDDDMSDFIVPDEEGEAFCPASPSSEFVRETHQLVHEYNQWEPKTPSEEKVKAFVDTLAHKYKQQDDERQFASGKCVYYDRPPLPKQ